MQPSSPHPRARTELSSVLVEMNRAGKRFAVRVMVCAGWIGILHGCSLFQSSPECSSPEQAVEVVASETLTCADVDRVRGYAEVLAARRIEKNQRARMASGLRARFVAAPKATRAELNDVASRVEELKGLTGQAAAAQRGRFVREWLDEQGPFSDAGAILRNPVSNAIASWSRPEGSPWVLTEMDIEGWIRLASLCREVQGAGPLRVSIADRETIYREMRARFRLLDHDQQLAVISVGPFWKGVQSRWQSASYVEQQAWIQTTPLPPPMTSTSLGYFQGVQELNPRRMADALHSNLGPFRLDFLE